MMGSLTCLLLTLLCNSYCVWVTAGETIIIKNSFDLSDQHVLLECREYNEAFRLVSRAVWTRGGEVFVPDSSRMTINENGTIIIAPTLPDDEGEYRCGADEESLGEIFNFAVSPRALKKSRQMFGLLGSNFSIPCPVEIGPISRQQGFNVEWIQRTQQPTGLSALNVLIQYEGNASEASTTLIASSFDSSHILNVSDLSLLVYDFSVPDVNQKEIYYTCRISAGPQKQQRMSALINVTTQFTPIKIITPLPQLIVGYPGEVITESFVYEGAPILDYSLSLAGENIAKSGKFKFRRELRSDNTSKIFLEIPEPQEDDSGLLIITLTGVNSTDWTEIHLIIIPQVTNLKLTCGEPILSFELPQQVRSPGVNLQLQTKFRFTEVPPFGTADSESRVVNVTYEIEAATTQDCPSDAERCTVDIDLRGRLPNEVAEFVRYRAEALILVNGTEGHQFSPSTTSILRNCNAPLEQEILTLFVAFIGELECSAVASETISEVLHIAIQGRCNFSCDDLAFGTPQLSCSTNNRSGNFIVAVTAFEANAVVADFYMVIQNGPVLFESQGLTFSGINECDTDNGGCNQTCTNTIGSFICSCGLGYELNEDGLDCSDFDECNRIQHNCDIIATCMNTVGSYDCMCIPGYEGTGFNQDCSNIDECARGTDNCDINADCMDTDGSFFCTCLEGFRGNGIICGGVDDECLEDSHNCHPNATCYNTIDSFNCTCDLGFSGNGVMCEEITAPTPMKSSGYLVTGISVSVPVGVLVILSLILIIAVVGVLFVRRRKKLAHDNQHIYESVSLYALEMKYNITVNDAYVPGTSASTTAQQNVANIERQNSRASHCSHEAVEGEEMRGSQDQSISSTHEHERDASVCYQAGDDYEQAQCYELAGGAYDQIKGQNYEQTSDPYERVQDYEQQQASGAYDQFKGQDYEQTNDPYERVQDYERQQASGAYDQVQSYERLQVSKHQDQVEDDEQLQANGAYDQVQSNGQLQAHTASYIQGYELVVQSRYCGLIQRK